MFNVPSGSCGRADVCGLFPQSDSGLSIQSSLPLCFDLPVCVLCVDGLVSHFVQQEEFERVDADVFLFRLCGRVFSLSDESSSFCDRR